MVSKIEQKRLDAVDVLIEDMEELVPLIKTQRERGEWLAAWNYLDDLARKAEKARATLAPLTMDGARS